MKRKLNFGSCLTVLLLTFAICFLLGWGLWTLAEKFVSPGLTRFWALLATVLIPLVAGSFYWLGQIEARGKVAGLDLGIEKVTRAASSTVDLRATATSRMREAVRSEPPPPIMLPDFNMREIIDGDVVEL